MVKNLINANIYNGIGIKFSTYLQIERMEILSIALQSNLVGLMGSGICARLAQEYLLS